MSGFASAIARLPRGAQIGILALVAIVLAVIAGMIGGVLAAMTVLAGGALVAGAVIAYRAFLHRRDERQASPFAGLLAGSAAGPTRIAEPARRARLDELRKSFESGIEKFRAAGKSLYSVPWYVLIGEPGSGKTEAIRHCGVGFPPGLQDELQGAGGTLNMSWWFTNQAVILDTAGRLLFEDVEPGSTSEWQEFLKLLRHSRPNCPINGLLVVIPADSLIRDTDDAIDAKAARIASQLDVIQKSLGVRFPAYVVITKSDLINGFREFFDRTDDPRAANQILGWSNPDSLDAPFRPDLVDAHLRSVEQRLVKRRFGLLIDPVNTDDARKPRIDQVDALYAFPESLSRLAPRLRRYMQRMFVAGEWSAQPLFLRGIYFTSALREGAALDADLAAALNVSPDKLPEGKIWERERALFLKDLFLNKVFKEKGLVTRAADTASLLRARAATLLGAAAAGLALITLLTWLGARGLQHAAVEPAQFWSAVAATIEAGRAPSVEPGRPPYRLPIVSKAIVTDEDFKYRGGEGADASLLRSLPIDADARRIGAFHTALSQRAAERIAVPLVFYPAAVLTGDTSGSLLETDRLAACRAAFEAGVLRPLVEGAVARLEADIAAGRPWTEDSIAALEQIVRIEVDRAAPGRQSAASPVQIEPLLRYVLSGNDSFLLGGAADDARSLQRLADSFYAGDARSNWPPRSIAVDRSAFIAGAIEQFAASLDPSNQSAAGPAGRLMASLEAFGAAESNLLETLESSPVGESWLTAFDAVRTVATQATTHLPVLAGRRLEQAVAQDATSGASRLREDAERLAALLQSGATASPTLARSHELLDGAVRSNSSRRINLDALSTRAKKLADAHIGTGVEPLFATRFKVYEAIAALTEGAAEPVPAFALGEGAPIFAELNELVTGTRASIQSIRTASDPRFAPVCAAAVDAATAARRTAIARACQVGSSVTDRTLLDAAQRLADADPVAAEWPTLPPMARAGGRIEPALMPAVAVPVLNESWQIAASGAAPGDALPAAAAMFFRRYTDAWTNGLSGVIAPEVRSWPEFHRELTALGSAESIRHSLRSHAATQSAAARELQSLITTSVLPSDAKPAAERLTRVAASSAAAVESPALDAAFDRILRNWKSLSSDPAEARRQLIDAGRAQAGVADFVVPTLVEPSELDLLTGWWRSLTLSAARSLAQSLQGSSAASGGPFAKFPLGKYVPGAEQLTPAQVVEARSTLTADAAPSISRGIRDSDLAAALEQIAAAGSAASFDRALLPVLPERADDRIACTFELVPDNGFAFAAVRIRQLGTDARSVAASGSGPVALGRIDYPGPSVQLEFLASNTPDAQPVAAASIPGPWLGLSLIAASGGKPVAAADARLWEAKLPVETASGVRNITVRIRFEDRMPPGPGSWPR